MRISAVLAAAGGILLAVVALCALTVFVEKKFPRDTFDERQKMSRGRAYRLSSCVGYLYYVGVAFILLRQVDGEKKVEPYILVFLGLMIQLMVDHTYCVMTHSALPLTQKRSWAFLSYLFCGAIYITMFFMDQKRYGISFVGYGTSALLFLMTGICFLYLALMHIIQLILDRKE